MESATVNYNMGFREGKEAGIKEVVEWIQGNCACFSPDEQERFVIEGWQAKLREWGIK